VTENLRNIKHVQSRDTDNIGYSRHRIKLNVRENQENIKYGQSRDTDNIEYTRYRTNKRERKPKKHQEWTI